MVAIYLYLHNIWRQLTVSKKQHGLKPWDKFLLEYMYFSATFNYNT